MIIITVTVRRNWDEGYPRRPQSLRPITEEDMGNREGRELLESKVRRLEKELEELKKTSEGAANSMTHCRSLPCQRKLLFDCPHDQVGEPTGDTDCERFRQTKGE